MTDNLDFNDDYDSNTSGNTEFTTLLQQHINRRDLIKKTAGGAVALTLAASAVGCSNSNDQDPVASNPNTSPPAEPNLTARPEKLTFKPVDKNILNAFTVAEGYEARVVFALGDPIVEGLPEWNDDQIPSGASFTLRSGECHDGMTFFGMTNARYDAHQSKEGLLVMNHEYIDNQEILHPKVNTISADVRDEDEVLREINCHGVSIIQIQKDPQTQIISLNKKSAFNRRITAATPIDFEGPVKGDVLLRTKVSPEGVLTLGTINNCGNGYTPWGTYLTTEENFNQYFSRDDSQRTPQNIYALDRYKIPKQSRLKWHTVQNAIDQAQHYQRWNTTISGSSASEDYRNSTNTFGWIVEIDPFDNRQRPVKRTALGRFAHEDCRASRAVTGQPLAFYMGDDSQGEYIYKFVSDHQWNPADINSGYRAGDKYMNAGKLYVAKFSFDEKTQKATGEWIELSIHNPLIAAYQTYQFTNQADLLVHARLAADAVGATKMDRPEWVAVHPETGEVYVTLTNNSQRGTNHQVDAANPRHYADQDKGDTPRGNINGHIIRLRENQDKVTALTFEWDIFLFGAEADALNNVNLSGLTGHNDFSSPDGMWFDPRGVLWIQTDDGAYTDETNCMMLAALPGHVGDGSTVRAKAGDQTQITPMGHVLNDSKLRRFLTGPSGCEITGVTMTPDYKAIFVNVQHPGGEWPNNHPKTLNLSQGVGKRPRSATMVITRKDGGIIVGEDLEPKK